VTRGYVSLAERYRAHREEMELVLATGCTPIEARQELRRREQVRRDACGRVDRGASASPELDIEHETSRPASFELWDADWMMRD
jgi:hypothetical protein